MDISSVLLSPNRPPVSPIIAFGKSAPSSEEDKSIRSEVAPDIFFSLKGDPLNGPERVSKTFPDGIRDGFLLS
ncbi:hypothetical protein JTE90_029318 [Oedothorax gibbosus]|uniref:Uncharacterized protein n=1 Tax=Oedothorax gibbosus TaxID=931172 RepID=A0AAV6UKB1_9ARAC|nr:hypothetical protein JTE90_029318 [Oedothorax gibbosus]